MEQLKKDITDLLNKSKETAYYKGSCGELGDSFQAIDVDYFADIVNDIAKIVENNYEPKKSIPEGYEKYVKDLEHFKENHVGLYVIDKMIDDIFTDAPDEKDCKTVVEAFLVQQFKTLKSLMWKIS